MFVTVKNRPIKYLSLNKTTTYVNDWMMNKKEMKENQEMLRPNSDQPERNVCFISTLDAKTMLDPSSVVCNPLGSRSFIPQNEAEESRNGDSALPNNEPNDSLLDVCGDSGMKDRVRLQSSSEFLSTNTPLMSAKISRTYNEMLENSGSMRLSFYRSNSKKSLQLRIYNFLERPTGWLCFGYHFTV